MCMNSSSKPLVYSATQCHITDVYVYDVYCAVIFSFDFMKNTDLTAEVL